MMFAADMRPARRLSVTLSPLAPKILFLEAQYPTYPTEPTEPSYPRSGIIDFSDERTQAVAILRALSLMLGGDAGAATAEAVHNNQQINIQQRPPQALGKLSPNPIMALYSATLNLSDKTESRRFEFAMDQANKETGDTIAAGIIVTFLATIIAVVVDSKYER